MVLREFGAIRADFLHYYGIRNPLVEEAEYMMTLIRYLPPDGAFKIRASRHFEDTATPVTGSAGSVPAWREYIAKMTGTKAPDVIMSEDAFLASHVGSGI